MSTSSHVSDLILPYLIEEDRGYITPCMIWSRSLGSAGYGQVWLPNTRRMTAVHRLVAIEAYGPLDPTQQVCHRCDQRDCARLDHLFIGTNVENMRDSVNKGRHHNKSKTQCSNGHTYDASNTYVDSTGRRHCRTCRRDRSRRVRPNR